jgi:hypothetical protein
MKEKPSVLRRLSSRQSIALYEFHWQRMGEKVTGTSSSWLISPATMNKYNSTWYTMGD